jgi:hypothetical protein
VKAYKIVRFIYLSMKIFLFCKTKDDTCQQTREYFFPSSCNFVLISSACQIFEEVFIVKCMPVVRFIRSNKKRLSTSRNCKGVAKKVSEKIIYKATKIQREWIICDAIACVDFFLFLDSDLKALKSLYRTHFKSSLVWEFKILFSKTRHHLYAN